MLCQNMDEDDLRLETISLRKHITRVCSENQVLKVKVRKLQDEMIKRDKQLDEFLTSKSFSGLNKKLQDKSASVILNLKLKNDKLEQIIVEKDITIKRLQNTIHTAKLYNANSLNQKFVSKGIECLLLNGKIDLKKKKISKMINLHIPNMQMDKCEDEDDGILQKEMKTTFTTGISDFRHDGYHNAEQEKEILLFPEGYGSMNSFNNVDENFFDFDTNLDNLQEKDYSTTFHNEAEENFMNRGKNLENNNEIFFSRDGMSLDNGEKVFNVPEKVFDMSESCVSNLLSPKTINVDMKETKQEALENQIRNGEKDYRIGTHSFDTLKVTFFEKIDDISSHSKETVDEKYNAEKTKDDEYSEYHEEMKQLHVHLMDMMSQVDYLKDTISQMKEDQDRNDENLKPKDGNIKELIKEIDKSQDNKLAVSPKTKRISNIKHNDSEEKDCTKSLKNSEKNSHSAVKKFHSTKHSKLAKSKSSVSDHKNEKKTLKNLFKPQDADKKLNTENLKNKKSDGWYIITYALGIYHLNLFIAFLTPKIDPALDFEDDQGPELPTTANEEFRPFIRRLPEFKFWYSVTKSTIIGFICTFFECFNIPVFWPILVMYFITLFCITMKRQIKHMIKYRYLPFTHGKPKYQGHEDQGKVILTK